MELQKNRHHTLWQARHYKGELYRTLRNHRGLVIPDVWIPQHKLLHAELPTPPKPSAELARLMLNNLDRPLNHKFDGLLYTIDYLTDHETKEAQALSLHLTRQLGYFAMGVENEISEIHDTRDSISSQQ